MLAADVLSGAAGRGDRPAMTWTRDVDPYEKGYSRQERANEGCSRLHGRGIDNRDVAFPAVRSGSRGYG